MNSTAGANTSNTANTVTRVQSFAAAERVAAIARALHAMQPQPYDVASTAMRAAGARDPAMMGVLEQVAEQIHAGVERQMGDSIRTHTVSDLKRSFEPTEVGLWRAAFEGADKGVPEPTLKWLYAAAGHAAGLVPFDDRTNDAVRRYMRHNNFA